MTFFGSWDLFNFGQFVTKSKIRQYLSPALSHGNDRSGMFNCIQLHDIYVLEQIRGRLFEIY